MKEIHWLLLYILVLAGYIVAMQLGAEPAMLTFKPMIMLVLLGYFDSQITRITKGMAAWILFAILFSMAGDTLLLFQAKNPQFFIFGLSAFLLAHICYIIFFHRVRKEENISFKPLTLLAVAVYYAALMWLLYPGLKEMKVPVMVYGVVISTMLMLAIHVSLIRNKGAGLLMLAGALLFVVSDSVLAVDKFYRHFQPAGIVIMITYGVAQFYIIRGAADYLQRHEKNK